MKKIVCILMVLALTASCSGFLEEYQTTSLTDKDVYDSEQALETNVNGLYLTLNNVSLWKGTMYEYFQTGSGLFIWGGNRTTDEWLDGMNFTKYSTSLTGNKNLWTALWLGISRCNRLLDNLPGSPVDNAFKKEIEAEARFLRAHFYFTAVRIYGDVPLIETAPVEPAELHNPRTDFWKIYKFVLDDLEFAEVNMRSPVRTEEAAPGKNRPNNWAATALKASVYLTIGSLLASPLDNFWDTSRRSPDFTPCGISSPSDAFTLAYQAAEKVITEGPYSLVPDYRTLFRWTEPGDWFLPESILKITSSNHSGQNYCSIHMLPPFPEGTANRATANSNAGRIRPSRFGLENFIRWSGGRMGTSGVFNTKVFCKTEDPRYAATFFDSYINQNTGKKVTAYPNDSNIPTSSDAYLKKYLDPTYDVTSGKGDFYLIRLAEMYLISAEASASLSSAPGDEYWGRAISRVNDLRFRARHSVDSGVSSYPADWTATTFETREDLINGVMWERLIEMMGEGHEWFDTHRRGATWLRDNIAVPANRFYMLNNDMETYVDYHFPGARERGYIFPTEIGDIRKGLLSAYPESELRLNTAENRQNDFFWQ